MSTLEDRINALANEARCSTSEAIDQAHDEAEATSAALERLGREILLKVDFPGNPEARRSQRILRLMD